MKKHIALFLSFLMVSTSLVYNVCAVNSEDGATGVHVNTESTGYQGYISKYNSIENAKNEMVLDNTFSPSSKKTSLNGDECIYLEYDGTAEWSFEVETEGLYTVSLECSFDYQDTGREPINASFKIDGNTPFSEAENISLSNDFCDDGNLRKDNVDNEVAQAVVSKKGLKTLTLENDSTGENFLFYFTKGQHKISLSDSSAPFGIKRIFLGIPSEKAVSYKEYSDKYSDAKKYDGDQCTFEAENTVSKNRDNIIQLSDNTSANVNPKDSKYDRINYIGGSSWSQPGECIRWTINVPEDGLYKIGVNYRQNSTVNSTFYRELQIDGAVPFEEAKTLKFEYVLNWKFTTLGNDEPYLFYLTKGDHEISLIVRLGPLSDISDNIDDITYKIAALYRSIVMITGSSPDANRDYNLFERVEDFEKKLDDYSNELSEAAEQLAGIYKSNSSSSISTINSMINVLQQMRRHKYTAHRYVRRYYDCYASLSSMSMDLSSMPLDIDRFYIGNTFNSTKTGAIEAVGFSVNRFFRSFVNDYSANKSKDNETITLWVNWGRDQAKVLKYLIQSDFSVNTGINVDIKITNATLTHAALSGNGPDVQLQLSRSEPVNLAMRSAILNLKEFSDYDEVLKRFMPGAEKCYTFGNGVYALPDTQTFYMMFVRKDILDEMGVEIPKTWNEFINTSVMLMRQNMQVGLPYTQIAEMTQVNAGVGALSIYPTLLIQNGGRLYNDERSKTDLLSDVSINAFTMWTDFYVKYGFPKTYDFFNRFRLGLMPIAIQNYTMYATVSAAAPEIADCWDMYEIPGISDGTTVDNSVTGGGTGAVILSATKHKDASWEFLKWWTSEGIQYQYGTEVENILGESARVATSNTAALKRYSWSRSTLKNLVAQWKKVSEIPEVPGGYYVSRVIDQAFWNVVNAGEDTQDMLMKWNDIAQTEIDRKREQYGIK